MAVNRDNKYRNALESFKQYCESKDALLDAYIDQLVAETKLLVEKKTSAKNEKVTVIASAKTSNVPLERTRPIRHAAEVAKSLIQSSMRFEKTNEKMRRPDNFDRNLMCSTMDIIKMEIQSEHKNIDQTVSEDNFIQNLKNNACNAFESTLINGNNRFNEPKPAPNRDSVDLNQLTIPMSTFRNDEGTFVVVTDGKKSPDISKTIVVQSESTLKITAENNVSSSSSSRSSSHYSLRSSKKRVVTDNNTPGFENEPKKLVQSRDKSPEQPQLSATVPESINNLVEDQTGAEVPVDSKSAPKKMIKGSKKDVATKAKTKVVSKLKDEAKPKRTVVLNLSDIVEEKSNESPEYVPNMRKAEAPRTPRTPRIRTRAMTKKLLMNAAVQMDAQIAEAALKRQEHLEKRRENARRKREDKAKKAFEQREILRTEKLNKLNQKKSKKEEEPQIVTKKQPLVELKNQPRPLTPSPPALPIIAPETEDIRPPPILPPPPHCSNLTKRVSHNAKEPISLNLDECDSDSDEYNSHAVNRVCSWVNKREYDSEHANCEVVLQLFSTGPATPNIRDIFEELEQKHLLRNSSIWED